MSLISREFMFLWAKWRISNYDTLQRSLGYSLSLDYVVFIFSAPILALCIHTLVIILIYVYYFFYLKPSIMVDTNTVT